MLDFPFNAVHFHLLLNHFPVVLIIFTPVILLYGLYKKSTDIIHTALLLFIAISIISIPTFLAGLEAIKTVSGVPGINIQALVLHQQIAPISFLLMIILGVLSTIVLLMYRKRKLRESYDYWYYTVLVFSLIVLVAVSLTGYYGGNIRHTEIHIKNG